jgi:hypothetical protein
MCGAGNNCKYTSRRQKRWQQEQIQNQEKQKNEKTKRNENRTTRKMLSS